MSTNIELAELDYAAGMKYKDIAEKYAVSLSTVKSWKTRYKWSRDKAKKICVQNKKSTRTKKEKVRIQNEDANLEEKVRKKIVQSIADNDELTEQRKLFCRYFSETPIAAKAYQKAYNVSYDTAKANGSRLLTIASVNAEIARLREIKYAAIKFDVNDLVERQMRIAFASMTDFLTIEVSEHPKLDFNGLNVLDKNGEPIMLKLNQVYLKENSEIDGDLISEVKEGTNGNVSLKLKDSTKAMEWLTKYFELNPQDKHKIAYDNARLDIERQKVEVMKGDKDTTKGDVVIIDDLR